MFTPIIRLLLLVLCSVLAILFALSDKMLFLLFITAFSMIILWDYLLRGTVPKALKRINVNDIDGAEKLIWMNNRPHRLNKKNEALYHFVLGFVYRERDKYDEANEHLQKALAMHIKNEHYRAMAYLSLADIALIQNNKALAKDYLLQMKNLKVQASLIPSIRKMQQYLGV